MQPSKQDVHHQDSVHQQCKETHSNLGGSGEVASEQAVQHNENDKPTTRQYASSFGFFLLPPRGLIQN